ncbi:MAG: tRNA (N6-isopentenyl adenosine(37)-C2)-methylthiotransferase MiaB [Deltaproteobacteria bacterium]|nr:tRNA (N6-isopentenyl adenosine(37)-C2)-methylthiotransferase MiaB [Deltaproteobacteria bacterium]
MKKVYVETYGCQMNEHDSERMLSILAGRGYERTDDPGDAGVVIVNTCSVRGKAEQKAYSSIGRYIRLKRRRPGMLVVFSGCVAQQDGKGILSRFRDIDVVVGPSQVHRIDELLSMAGTDGRAVAVEPYAGQDRFRSPVRDAGGVKAYVTIMEGCDNFCTYCTVPYLRGREVSRRAREIVDEVYALVGSGVREVVLLGQNVNSYTDASGGRGIALYGLLSMLNEIQGLERIRFITSHPKDLSDGLIAAFADFDKICRHIHLPVQSGSDRILGLMARGYTTHEYMGRIERLRKAVPGIAVTSDFIVGFPSETEDDHGETILFVKNAGYDNVFSFKYSDRPLAAASRLGNKVRADVIARRLKELQSVQLGVTRRIYGSLVGTVQRVLVEGRSKREGRLQGRTSQGRIVNFEGGADAGSLVDVMIEDYSDNALYGRCMEMEAGDAH